MPITQPTATPTTAPVSLAAAALYAIKTQADSIMLTGVNIVFASIASEAA